MKMKREVKHYRDLPNIEGIFTFSAGGQYRFCYSQKEGRLVVEDKTKDHWFDVTPRMFVRKSFIAWKDISNQWLTRKTKSEIERMLLLLIRDNKRNFLENKVTTLFRTIRQPACQDANGVPYVFDLTFKFILVTTNNAA